MKFVTVSNFPTYFPWSDGTRCHGLGFWMLSFKPAFSFSSSTFMEQLFSSSSLSVIRVVSSAYIRLLIFLLAILISACGSFGPSFYMMYSAYKLNKQGDNIQPWRTLFPILNQLVVPCLFLIVASYSAYRFLRRQVSWSGIPISWRIFYTSLWSTQSKALFSLVNEAEVDDFSLNSRAFLWSKWCWQFDLGFFCLFWVQLEHLEVLSSCTVEA